MEDLPGVIYLLMDLDFGFDEVSAGGINSIWSQHCSLGGGIVGTHGKSARFPRYRAHIDDLPRSLPLHNGHYCFGTKEHAFQINIENSIPIFLLHMLNGTYLTNPRIVNKYVSPTKLL
jgi:hypothetical protein